MGQVKEGNRSDRALDGDAVAARPRRRLRLAGLVAIQLLVVVLGAELAALGVARLRTGDHYGTIAMRKEEFLRLVPQETPTALDPDKPLPLNVRREIAPFFGFTYERAGRTRLMNNLGFFSEFDFPYQPRARELVVGVFGGSVAMDLRLPGPYEALRTALLPAAKARGYDEVTILVMAQGSWHEPQSLFCFLYFVDTIDVALFLEGFNEIAMLPLVDGVASRSYPWSFPDPKIYERLLGRVRDVDALVAEVRIRELRASERWWSEVASGPILGRSMMVHLAWRAGMARFERRIEELLPATGASAARPYESTFPPGLAMPELRRAFFDRFETWIEMASRAGELRRKPLFHFIQPNQYVEGSKPPSDQEKRVALVDDTVRRRVADLYPELRRMSERLRARGVAATDLTMIFEGNPATLYKDASCHLNAEGMTLIAQEMGRAVAASAQIGTLPAPDERALPFGPRAADAAPRRSARDAEEGRRPVPKPLVP